MSVIGVLEIIINIISCHGFVNNTKSDVIFLCRIKLVYYYPSKGIFILRNNISALRNVPLCAKQIINLEHIYKNDFIMA